MTGRRPLSVVVFSGGRGSSVLSQELITHSGIVLTLAINGYDDGMSTGEVRRFLGDALGPSDFRKNASHLARVLRTCPESDIDLLDRRLPSPCTRDDALVALRQVGGAPESRIAAFERELIASGQPFDFSDCAIGNIAFAGSFLLSDRDFNKAVDDYCGLLRLPPGLIENVTDGTNAYLVALDRDDTLLASEADIVDAKRQNRIKDIYLLDRKPSEADTRMLTSMPPAAIAEWLESRRTRVRVNPNLVEKIARADLIVYSPGTQHSSLFPSYLTEGLSEAIAGNLSALKLLITNIQRDVELTGASAVDIVERAMYYLRDKGRLPIPTPFLITHYLFNDPAGGSEAAPYVPLGRLDALEDPRLVRIGNYEDGITGRHDPAKVLTPFLESYLREPRRQRVAVWLTDSGSRSKVSQTLLEMVRAGIQDLALDFTVFYGGIEQIDREFTARFPFPVRWLGAAPPDAALAASLADGNFDYVLIFESSGMYNGEDLVTIAAPLAFGRLDAVWGSRRLSLRDIEASLRLRYRHRAGLRLASTVGSHLLSAAYLVLYGRYISDTLSGVRAVRAAFVTAPGTRLSEPLLNQRLLSRMLADRAEILETPVRFYAMSPAQVRRTTVMDGVRALTRILWWRLSGASHAKARAATLETARSSRG
ncbi:MAG TPA: 2-phospho-L-lactate transferase CofD family protein [Vicinamibacterales bacterium]|nr:2-phospho-L-lactate transferase CofD family protein [Vicinamibacterales bacterium]